MLYKELHARIYKSYQNIKLYNKSKKKNEQNKKEEKDKENIEEKLFIQLRSYVIINRDGRLIINFFKHR